MEPPAADVQYVDNEPVSPLVTMDHVGGEFRTGSIVRAANALVQTFPTVKGLVMGSAPVVSESSGGILTGYAAVLKMNRPIGGELFDALVGPNGENPLFSMVGMYRIKTHDASQSAVVHPVGPAKIITADETALRANLKNVRTLFESTQKSVDSGRTAPVTLSTPRPVAGTPTMFTTTMCCDKDTVEVLSTFDDASGKDVWMLTARTHLPQVSRELVALAKETAMTPKQFMESDEYKHALDLNCLNNAQAAAMAASKFGVEIDTEPVCENGPSIGKPISVFTVNQFRTVEYKRNSPLAVFYNRMQASDTQAGGLVGVSPRDGYLWFLGNKEDAPEGAYKAYGGSWKNKPTLNMFPAGTGRTTEWDKTTLSDISREDFELARARVAIGGGVEATRRIAPVYAKPNLMTMREIGTSFGAPLHGDVLNLRTKATYLGPPKNVSINYMLNWWDTNMQRIPIDLTNSKFIGALSAAFSAAKQSGDSSSPFAVYSDLQTLLADETKDHKSVKINRNIVKFLIDSGAYSE